MSQQPPTSKLRGQKARRESAIMARFRTLKAELRTVDGVPPRAIAILREIERLQRERMALYAGTTERSCARG